MADPFTIAMAAGSASQFNNVVGSFASNAQSYHQSKKLMKLQAALNYYYGRKTAENGPSWNRTGLESAGYNPMLAVQNATSGVNSSWSGLNNSQASDYGSAISEGISNAQSFQRLKNETDVAESQTDANYANADKAKAEKQSLLEHLPWISKREKAEIGNIEKDSIKKEAEIHNIDETTRFIEKNYELQKMLGIRGQDKALQGQIYNADSLAETMRGTIETKLPFFGSQKRYYEKDDISRMKKRGYKTLHNDYDNKDYWHYY